MQKLINGPEDFVEEMLDGIVKAHPDQLRLGQDPRAIVRADAPLSGKVAIATGGGSGHLPVFMGYVGRGLADGAAVGNVFASPSADQMLAVIRAIDGGAGVLLLYGNYGGDVMNFGLAAELAAAEGIGVPTVRGADDVASAPRGRESRRRGIAGIFFLYKVAGACAAAARPRRGRAATERAAGGLRSMGVALSPCTVPAAGRPTFELPAGEMEIGMGIHGEPGVRRGPLETADEVADQLVEAILADLPLARARRSTCSSTASARRRRRSSTSCSAARTLGWPTSGCASVGHGSASTRLRSRWPAPLCPLLRVDDELAELLDAPASAPLLARI